MTDQVPRTIWLQLTETDLAAVARRLHVISDLTIEAVVNDAFLAQFCSGNNSPDGPNILGSSFTDMELAIEALGAGVPVNELEAWLEKYGRIESV